MRYSDMAAIPYGRPFSTRRERTQLLRTSDVDRIGFIWFGAHLPNKLVATVHFFDDETLPVVAQVEFTEASESDAFVPPTWFGYEITHIPEAVFSAAVNFPIHLSMFAARFPELRSLTLQIKADTTVRVGDLSMLTALTRLELLGRLGTNFLGRVGSLGQLTALTRFAIEDSTQERVSCPINGLDKLTSLTSLRLSRLKGSQVDFKQCLALTRLREIDIVRCTLDDDTDAFRVLHHLPNLRRVYVYGSSEITVRACSTFHEAKRHDIQVCIRWYSENPTTIGPQWQDFGRKVVAASGAPATQLCFKCEYGSSSGPCTFTDHSTFPHLELLED